MEWIKTTDRLPKETLIVKINDSQNQAFYHRGAWVSYPDFDRIYFKVKNWQPLSDKSFDNPIS